MKKKSFLFLGILLDFFAIIFMIFTKPYVVKWANPNPFIINTSSYSYFDIVPYGFGHFTPLITVILTIISVVLLLISYKYCKIIKFAFFVSLLCVIFSIISLITSYSLTFLSVFISLLLIISFSFQCIYKS